LSVPAEAPLARAHLRQQQLVLRPAATDADAMRRDAAFLAHLAAGHANRPFCVIDAGWTPGGPPGRALDAGDPAFSGHADWPPT
jgi:hypothetical protein